MATKKVLSAASKLLAVVKMSTKSTGRRQSQDSRHKLGSGKGLRRNNRQIRQKRAETSVTSQNLVVTSPCSGVEDGLKDLLLVAIKIDASLLRIEKNQEKLIDLLDCSLIRVMMLLNHV